MTTDELKRDGLGTTRLVRGADGPFVERDVEVPCRVTQPFAVQARQ